MPVLNREIYQPQPPPDPEVLSGKSQKVFYLPITNEISLTYPEHVDRYMACRRPMWQCATTGKTGLTYREACESEAEARRSSEVRFNDDLKREILVLAHGKTTPMRAVVSWIIDLLRHVFYIGEFVHYNPPEFKRTLRHARIVQRVFKDPSDDPAQEFRVETPSHYKIQILNDSGHPIKDSEREVAAHELWRPRTSMTRDHVRELIKANSTRATSTNAPILLKASLRQQYDVVDQEVYDYSEQEGVSATPRERSTPEPTGANKRKSLAGTPAGLNTKSSKREHLFDGMEFTRSPTSGRIIPPYGKSLSVPGSPRKGKKAVTKASRAGSPAPLAKAREPTPKPPPIKYPIEDLLLLTLSNKKPHGQTKLNLSMGQLALSTPNGNEATSESVPEWPMPSFDYIIPAADVEGAINTWSFLNIFSKPLYLSPFSFDDFEQALQHRSDSHDGLVCDLLTEVLCSCLNAIIDNLHAENKVGELTNSNAMLVDDEDDSSNEDANVGEVDGTDASVGSERKPSRLSRSRTRNGGGPRSTRSSSPEDEVSDDTAIQPQSEKAQSVTGTADHNPPQSAQSDSDHSKKDSHSVLRKTKLKLSQEWFKTLIPSSRANWTSVLLGWLLHTSELYPELAQLTAHLCEVFVRSPTDFIAALETMSVSEKLIILDHLTTTATGSWAIRDYIEECHEHLSIMRKERIDINRESKKIAEEQAQITKSMDVNDSDETAEATSLSSADVRKAARERAQEQQEQQKALRKLQEQADRNARKLEQLEKDTRKFNVFGVSPLGRDRFYSTYWYFDGIGGTVISGSGRLFVRFTSPHDPALLADGRTWDQLVAYLPPDYPALQSATEAKAPKSATTPPSSNPSPASSPSFCWGYYTQPDQVDQLLKWLNTKGNRELALSSQLEGVYRLVTNSMKRRQQDLNAILRNEGQRKITRLRGQNPASALPRPAYLTYKNKLAP
ncbi:hypothetical protein H4R33_002290 [Dimargaris cristalligena]|uniref:ATP-utilizing chromatin assembly and remodelling N-terminal-domain-containing protein n=1 Tax=Dimargaris cristalligena TaxID=215637 RepID=A0A4P9ZR68_9FUNG|nr:hypothetical protein H4R33_002290 [Dimargaris cristalligena]RKP35933.1 ATP-utilizing chromatin assembly and remodelling N-terminal-domain-containing protein [Dimargaris cristalligena]|eukprot:RKP35933.1 ATP-utilizing chromatin assembly and remodelling N-terminal-domain-containing protein [Dimargaris cristalligena]